MCQGNSPPPSSEIPALRAAQDECGCTCDAAANPCNPVGGLFPSNRISPASETARQRPPAQRGRRAKLQGGG
eukprot:6719294-Pyramimonas_sp.AAC.1